MSKQIHFQTIFNFNYSKRRADGWNVLQSDKSATEEEKNDCIEKMKELTGSKNKYVNKTEVYIILGVAYLKSHYRRSYFSLRKAMRMKIIDSKVYSAT